SRAMMAHATGRPFREDVTGYQASLEESSRRAAAGPNGGDADAAEAERWSAAMADLGDAATGSDGSADGGESPAVDGDGDETDGDEEETPPDEHARPRPEADGSMTGGGGFEPAYEPWPDEEDLLASGGSGTVDAVVDETASGSSEREATAGATPEPEAGSDPTDRDRAGDGAGTAEADGGADILVPGDESEAETGPADWDGSFDGDSASGEILVPGETAGTGRAGGDEAPPDATRSDDPTDPDDPDGSPETDDEADSGGDIIVPGETGTEEGAETATGSGAGNADGGPETEEDAESGSGGGDDIIVPGEDDGASAAGEKTPDAESDPGASSGASEDIVVAGVGDEPSSEDEEGTVEATGGDGAGGPDRESAAEARDADGAGDGTDARADRDPAASFAERDDPEFERPVVREIRETVESLDPVTRGMLAYYRSNGPASPVDAQVAAGGDGDRTRAYGRNRELREAGLVAHAGRGTYGYALRSRIDGAHDGRLATAALDAAVERVEAAFLDRSDAPWPEA
ncbi:MAG: hypothetical protein V5A60_10255, partial [Haloarculaceae archaeon]